MVLIIMIFLIYILIITIIISIFIIIITIIMDLTGAPDLSFFWDICGYDDEYEDDKSLMKQLWELQIDIFDL